MGVQVRRLGLEGVEDEVVGRGLGAWVAGVEGERDGPVEEVGEGDEGFLCVGEVEEEKGRDGLLLLVPSSERRERERNSRCSLGRSRYPPDTWRTQTTHPPNSREAGPPPGRSASRATSSR